MQQGEGSVTTTWLWYYHQDSIYESKGEEWWIYTQIGRRRSRTKRYVHTTITASKPPLALPCTVERDGTRLIMTGIITPEQPSPTTTETPSFAAFLKHKLSTDNTYSWIYKHIIPPSEDQLKRLKTAIESNDLIGCTDSSVKNNIATASFAFQAVDKEILLQGDVIIPGYSSIQCPYRGEMGGAAAALHYLQTVMEYKEISSGSIRFGCDSDGVVNIGLTQTSQTNSVADHYDLIRLCRKSRTDMSPVKIVPVTVQGHTDKLHRSKTAMEKLNILCDQRATRMRKRVVQQNLATQPGHIQFWQLSYKGMPINSKLESSLKDLIHVDQSLDYWTKQSTNPLKPSTTGNIDWKAIGTAMKESSLYKRHFVSKHSTGHCGVGKMMKRWGFRTDDSCPRCKSPNESALHVIICPHASASKLWLEQIEALKTWMKVQKTKGDIITAIVRNLKKLRKMGGIYGHHYKDNRLRLAITAQNQIGWDHFMMGRISKLWSTLQSQHYQAIKSRRTGERWATNLLKQIWNIHWSMWNHRNEVLHSTGNHPVLGSRRFDKEISRELKKGCALLHSTERYLFAVTMDDVKEWTAIRKQKWLRTVSAARYSSSVRHQSTQQSRLCMHNWLQRR